MHPDDRPENWCLQGGLRVNRITVVVDMWPKNGIGAL